MKANHNKFKLFILFAVSILVYSNTLNHGYVLDDFSVIKDNFVVQQGVDGISTIFKTHYRYGYGFQTPTLYRPLTLSVFALQWEIAPDTPALAHAMNILTYGVLVYLIFLFLQLLFQQERPWLAFVTALLFALHPIHTEVVANIKSFDELLAFSLVLISLYQLVKYVDLKQKKSLLISLLLFLLACFSKESTVTFLGIIPIILTLFRNVKWKRALQLSSFYLGPVIVYLLARKSVLGSFGGSNQIVALDNVLVSAPNELIRIASAFKIMGLYLWKMLIPHPLMNDYSLQQIQLTNWSDPLVWISFIIYLSLIFLLFKTWNKNKILAFTIGFYSVSISLYTNLFFTIGTSFGERLLFIPSLSFCLLLAFGILYPFQNQLQFSSFKTATKPLILTTIIGLVYGFKTMDRNAAWKDNFTLYSTDVKNCSASARCQYYYALGLMKHKANEVDSEIEKKEILNESIQALDRALTIYPTYAEAYAQRGLAFYRMKNFSAALYDYQQAVKFNPGLSNAWSNMGSLYFEQKQFQQAKQSFEKAIQVNPNHVDALANYASTLGTLGDFNSAITYFKKASALKPTEPSYYQMIGVTYQNMGRNDLATPYLQKAQALSR